MQRSKDWWRESVVYQIYPRSYADLNGDGIGDIPGIRTKVPYLVELGIDAVWLSPHYPSPMLDAGYDVANYRDVEPLFGNLGDIEGLISDLHNAGLKIFIDIVPNHTSWEHAWFKEALANPPANDPAAPAKARYADGPWARYHLLRGRDGGALPPNEWPSVFGGDAWHQVDDADGNPSGWWYLHIFDKSQPDIDWDNQEVRAEFRGHLRFWFDRGVDGFRIDVAHGLAKPDGYPDFEVPPPPTPTNATAYWDNDGVHEIWREWRTVSDEYEPSRAFVAEAWVRPVERELLYVRKDELHTGFNFPYLTTKWNSKAFRETISESLAGNGSVDAPTTWVLENHDVWRVATRYAPIIGESEFGDEVGILDIHSDLHWEQPRDLEIGRKRARAGMMMMLALPGPAYIYQGQELGLDEVFDIPVDLRQDPSFINTDGKVVGRDGCRVPIPWDRSSVTYGFNSGDESWLPQPERWAGMTAAEQSEQADSMLNLTRAALKLRKSQAALGGVTDDCAPLMWDDDAHELVSFVRPGRLGGKAIRVVVNMGSFPVEIKDQGEVILESTLGALRGGLLDPDTCVWIVQ